MRLIPWTLRSGSEQYPCRSAPLHDSNPLPSDILSFSQSSFRNPIISIVESFLTDPITPLSKLA
jgi:hypothetical protein